jgi:hypothetical protein
MQIQIKLNLMESIFNQGYYSIFQNNQYFFFLFFFYLSLIPINTSNHLYFSLISHIFLSFHILSHISLSSHFLLTTKHTLNVSSNTIRCHSKFYHNVYWSYIYTIALHFYMLLLLLFVLYFYYIQIFIFYIQPLYSRCF